MPRRPRRHQPDPPIEPVDTDPSAPPEDTTVRTRQPEAHQAEEDDVLQGPAPLEMVASAAALALECTRDDTVLEIMEGATGRHDTALEAAPGTWGEVTRTADRVRWLESELRRNPARDARISLLLELGEVYWQDLNEAALSERAYSEVLSLDPTNLEAFDALERIYVVSWQTENRIELLINRTERVESAGEQALLLQRLAGLYEQLGQLDKATITLETARKLDPSNRAVIAHHERLTRPPEPTQPKDLLELLSWRLESETDDSARVDILERMAGLHQQRGHPAEAAHCLEEILAIDPRRLSCYQRLEQQHLESQRFEELARVLARHVEVAPAEQRARLYGQLAKLYEGPLSDAERARQAYNALLRAAPDYGPALHALLRLSEHAGDWETAAHLLERLSSREANPTLRADLLHRLAVVQLEHLDLAGAAEDTLLHAAAEAPAHAGTVAQLAAIYRKRSDWGKLTALLLAAEAASASPREKVQRLYDAGQAVLTGLGDEERATEIFERVIALDPDHAQAAAPLSEIHWRLGHHEQNLPLLELLVRKAGPDEREKLAVLHLRLALANESLERADRAERHYRQVLAIDSGHSRALLGQANLAFRAQKWSEALSCFINAQRTGKLSKPELVQVLHRSAHCAQQLGQRARAIELLERALELQPGHSGVVEALAALQGESENWEAVLAAKRGLVAAAPAARRPELHRELAQICWRRLGRPADAEQELRQALSLKPDDHALLHDLIELYSETEQWAQTVEVCQRMAELERQPALRAKYHHTIAVICRDKLNNADAAVESFNRVLDEDPEQLQAFAAIDALCTKRRAWKQLEQCYGRMINRLPKDGQVKLKAMLWHNLGEILRSRRRDFEGAAKAFEIAYALEPDNLQRLRILAELYRSLGPAYAAKLVGVHHELLRREPGLAEHYRTLRQIYMSARQYDRAWCMCMALVLLQCADREEQGFFKQYRRQRIPVFKAPLTDELWRRNICHSAQNACLSAIFGLVAPIVGPMTARPAVHFGLKPKHLRSGEHDALPLVCIFDQATAVLGVPEADLYLRPDRPEGLLGAHTQGVPSFVAGARVLGGASEKALAFLVGKELTFLRPEHFLRNALPAVAQLQAVLLAVLKLFQPTLPLNAAQTKALAPLIEQIQKHLAPAAHEQLGRLVHKLCAESLRGQATLTDWCRAVDLTSDRVGLLLCNDLKVAARVITGESGSDGATRERVAQLVQWATSEAYLDLRSRLGVDLEQ